MRIGPGTRNWPAQSVIARSIGSGRIDCAPWFSLAYRGREWNSANVRKICLCFGEVKAWDANMEAPLGSDMAAECVQCCNCGESQPTEEPPIADDCLKVRKWWCFLLSSIFTFLAGLLIVLLWRAFAFLCCRKEPELAPNDPKQKEQKAQRGKQEFEGTFMTEAKDWAGELISGQTTTGRILVSEMKNPN